MGFKSSQLRGAFETFNQLNGSAYLPELSTPRAALDSTCFLVNQVNKSIEQCIDVGVRTRFKHIKNDAASWLRNHFEENPKDRIPFSDHIQGAVLGDFPWEVVRPETSGLALLYNFSPFQDTGATVASKRIREFSATVDVVACSFLNRKKADQTIEAIAQPYVNSRVFLPLTPSWASWGPFQAFVAHANRVAEAYIKQGRTYDFVYSRAMWAPSIYAGAYFKLNHPSIKWIAEFSDPMSLDVEGLPRGPEVPNDEFTEMLLNVISLNFPDADLSRLNIFSLAEYLAYTLADEIIFTNSNQMETMLEHVPEEAIAARVRAKAIVSNHPTLPREYYQRENTNYLVDPQKLNLGYFGEFYSSRGITEITAAIRSLPDHIRDRINLHVFTNYIPATDGTKRPRNFSQKQYDDLVARALSGVGAEGIEHLVRLNPSLPYLRFLSTTEKLDYLIVNDAKSGEHHNLNPYLPSKWSDYAGSSAKTWAFVEKGSILSTKPATVKTPVADVTEARDVLWQMVEEKFPEMSCE